MEAPHFDGYIQASDGEVSVRVTLRSKEDVQEVIQWLGAFAILLPEREPAPQPTQEE